MKGGGDRNGIFVIRRPCGFNGGILRDVYGGVLGGLFGGGGGVGGGVDIVCTAGAVMTSAVVKQQCLSACADFDDGSGRRSEAVILLGIFIKKLNLAVVVGNEDESV